MSVLEMPRVRLEMLVDGDRSSKQILGMQPAKDIYVYSIYNNNNI